MFAITKDVKSESRELEEVAEASSLQQDTSAPDVGFSLPFCSGNAAERLAILVKRKVIDARGNLLAHVSHHLPPLTADEQNLFFDTLFKGNSLLQALYDLIEKPASTPNGRRLPVNIVRYVCVGSTVPHLLFGVAPKNLGKNHIPYIKRCLALFDSEDLYGPDIENSYTQEPSDIDIRAVTQTTKSIDEVVRNEYYQYIRSHLNNKAIFRPGVDDKKNQFAVIKVKLPGIKKKIDFIVCFDSARKCVFNLDSLFYSFTLGSAHKKQFSIHLSSHITNPLQAVIDHTLKLVKVAQHGAAPVDKRGWFKLITCLVKGKTSGAKGLEVRLWTQLRSGYLQDKKRGLKPFIDGLGHWLHTHHFGAPQSAFIFLLNAMQFIIPRFTEEETNTFIKSCAKWNRFKNLILPQKKGFISDLARLFFSPHVPTEKLFAILQTIAYLADSKKQKQKQLIFVERFYHEFSDPIYKICFGTATLQMVYAPVQALKTLLAMSDRSEPHSKTLINALLPYLLTLFPLGHFWSMSSSRKKQISHVVDLEKIDEAAHALIKSDSPFLLYLGLLIAFTHSISVKAGQKGALLIKSLPKLLKLSFDTKHAQSLFTLVKKVVGSKVDVESLKKAAETAEPKEWIEFLVSQAEGNLDFKKIAFSIWSEEIKQGMTGWSDIFSLKLMASLAKSHPQLALKILNTLRVTSLLTDGAQMAFDTLVEASRQTNDLKLMIYLARTLERVLEEREVKKSSSQLKILVVMAYQLSLPDPQKALAILKQTRSIANQRYVRLWCTVLQALIDKLDPLTLFSLFQKHVHPISQYGLNDDLFLLLLKLAKKPLLESVVPFMLHLRCESAQIEKQRSLFLLKVGRKQMVGGQLDKALLQALQPSEQFVLRVEMTKQAIEDKDFEKGAVAFLTFICDNHPLDKTLGSLFKVFVAKSSLTTASHLVKEAVKHGQLSLRHSISYVIYLGQRALKDNLLDLQVIDWVLGVLDKVAFSRRLKVEIHHGLAFCLDLLERYPLIEDSLLCGRKCAFEAVLPKFIPYLKEKETIRLATQIYRNGIDLASTFENANFWLNAIEKMQNEDMPTIYNLLKPSKRYKFYECKELEARFISVKCHLIKRWAKKERKTPPLAYQIFEELIPFAGTKQYKLQIRETLLYLVAVLQIAEQFKKIIQLVNAWYLVSKDSHPSIVDSAIASMWALEEHEMLPTFLLESEVLQNDSDEKQIISDLVNKTMRALAKKGKEHWNTISKLFIGYLCHLLPKRKNSFSVEHQQLYHKAIQNIKDRKDLGVLKLLDARCFFEAFTIEALRIKVVVACVQKALRITCKLKMRSEIFRKVGQLIDKENKRVHDRYDLDSFSSKAVATLLSQEAKKNTRHRFSADRNYIEINDCPQQIDSKQIVIAPKNEVELTPLFLVELEYLTTLFKSKSTQVRIEGGKRLKQWIQEPHSDPVWKAVAPLANVLIEPRNRDVEHEFLSLLCGCSKLRVKGFEIMKLTRFMISKGSSEWLCLAVSILINAYRVDETPKGEGVQKLAVDLFDALLKDGTDTSFKMAEALMSLFRGELVSQALTPKISEMHLLSSILSMRLASKILVSMPESQVRVMVSAMEQALPAYLVYEQGDQFLQNYITFLAKLSMSTKIYARWFITSSRHLWSCLGLTTRSLAPSSRQQSRKRKKLFIDAVLEELDPTHKNAVMILDHITFFIAIFVQEFALSKIKMKPMFELFREKAIKAKNDHCYKNLEHLMKQSSLISSFQTSPDALPNTNIEGIYSELLTLLKSKNNFDFHLGVNVFKFAEEHLLFSGFKYFIQAYKVLIANSLRKYPDPNDLPLILAKLNRFTLSSWGISGPKMPPVMQKIIPFCRTQFFYTVVAKLCGGIKKPKGEIVQVLLPKDHLEKVWKNPETKGLVIALIDMLRRDVEENLFVVAPMLLLQQIYTIAPWAASLSEFSIYNKDTQDWTISTIMKKFKNNCRLQEKKPFHLKTPDRLDPYLELINHTVEHPSQKSHQDENWQKKTKEMALIAALLFQFADDNMSTLAGEVGLLEKKNAQLLFN